MVDIPRMLTNKLPFLITMIGGEAVASAFSVLDKASNKREKGGPAYNVRYVCWHGKGPRVVSCQILETTQFGFDLCGP